MGIASHHHRGARLPTRVHRLPSALVMPTVNHHRIETPLGNDVIDFWRIESPKTSNAGSASNVRKKSMRITIEQRNVPIKLHPEACVCLLPGGRVVAKKDFNT